MSEQSIYTKLLNIQNQLNVPKNQYNGFGKYNYRSCEDILEAVKPLCKEQGLLLTLDDEIFMIGDRFYVRATATITDGKDNISKNAFAREDLSKKGMDGSQVTGAASSYARKYALNGLFCIDDNKDADTAENRTQQQQGNQKQQQLPQPPPPPAQPVICPRCNREIAEMKTGRGNTWTPLQILNKYQMCKDCYLEQKQESEGIR